MIKDFVSGRGIGLESFGADFYFEFSGEFFVYGGYGVGIVIFYVHICFQGLGAV